MHPSDCPALSEDFQVYLRKKHVVVSGSLASNFQNADILRRRLSGSSQRPFQSVIEICEVSVHLNGIRWTVLFLIVQRHKKIPIRKILIHQPGQFHYRPSDVSLFLSRAGPFPFPCSLSLVLSRPDILLDCQCLTGFRLSFHNCHSCALPKRLISFTKLSRGRKIPVFLDFYGAAA